MVCSKRPVKLPVKPKTMDPTLEPKAVLAHPRAKRLRVHCQRGHHSDCRICDDVFFVLTHFYKHIYLLAQHQHCQALTSIVISEP
jgi:hypothetical protein